MSVYERNNYANTKASKEGEGEGDSGTSVEIPLQLVVNTMVRQEVVPL